MNTNHISNRHIKRLLSGISILLLSLNTLAQSDSTVYNYSLQELGNITIKAPATLIHLAESETPASITTINKNDIALTPARNIYDLLEIYAPGGIWLNHEEGPHMGLRGIISNRNYQYLLLVNGRNLNNKAHYGAKSELEQWDLSDIEKIEVIRGSGSVTYGPGAVGGVINIITKTAENAPGLNTSIGYIGTYNSKQANISYGKNKGKIKLFSSFSIASTSGLEPEQYIGTKTEGFGIIGKEVNLNDKPLHYFGDAYNTPQIKGHIDLQIGDEFRLWTRYTQQGSYWSGNEVKTESDNGLVNQQSTQDRQFTTTLEHKKTLSANTDLVSVVSFDSYDAQRIKDNDRVPNDIQHTLNKKNSFSEHEVYARSAINTTLNKKHEIAFGLEYSYDYFGRGWGENSNEMRLGDESNIVNNASSLAILDGNGGSANRNNNAVYVGDGWSTNTFSLFGEAKFQLPRGCKILTSARLDKNTNSKVLFSPRVAFIKNIKNQHFIKLIAQQSVRMNTATEMYLENLYGDPSSSEKLNGLELIYSYFITENAKVNVSSFYNKIDLIAFQGDINASAELGQLDIAGAEVELKSKTKKGNYGLSYSFIKQINWKMNDEFSRTGVSYSDYNDEILDENGNQFMLEGTGNDLNNWPNQNLKLYANYDFLDWWTLHLDFKLLFDYQGSQDGITGIQNGIASSSVVDDINEQVSDLEHLGVFQENYSFNFSSQFKLGNHMELYVFAQNMLDNQNHKRYAYMGGHSDATLRKIRFLDEPYFIGSKFKVKF